MISLKFALIAMMVGSNFMPMNHESVKTAFEYPAAQIEVIEETTPSATMVNDNIDTIKINSDKAYNQCMREAFERVYEEVNKRLAAVTDSCSDQLELQNTM